LSGSNTASRSMITFLALNTSSLTLVPTTVIAIRTQYEAHSPTEIVGTTIIATTITTISAIILDRIFYAYSKKVNEEVSMYYYITLISTWIIPMFILITLLLASWRKIPAYELFVEGGKEGIQMAISILPFLLGMIVAIAI